MTFSNSRGFLITIPASRRGFEAIWRIGASEAVMARGYSSPFGGSNARDFGAIARKLEANIAVAGIAPAARAEHLIGSAGGCNRLAVTKCAGHCHTQPNEADPQFNWVVLHRRL